MERRKRRGYNLHGFYTYMEIVSASGNLLRAVLGLDSAFFNVASATAWPFIAMISFPCSGVTDDCRM